MAQATMVEMDGGMIEKYILLVFGVACLFFCLVFIALNFGALTPLYSNGWSVSFGVGVVDGTIWIMFICIAIVEIIRERNGSRL